MNDSFRDRLRHGEPLLGTLLSLPSPEIAELLAQCGFDWLFLDMEHGLLDFAAVQRMVQAAGPACACLVRVPSADPNTIGKALDTGATGLVVPHVSSAAAAAAAVRSAKYPPLGDRSIGAARAQGYGRRLASAMAQGNDESIVVAQVEHVAALGQIDAMLDVQGVDAVFIGPFDLSASMGKPGEITAAEVRAAIDTLAGACAARGKPHGIFVVDGDAAREAFACGRSLVCVSSDTLLLADAASYLLSRARR